MHFRVAAAMIVVALLVPGCGRAPCDDQGSLKAFLVDVERWLEVRSFPDRDIPEDETVTVPLQVAPVGRGGAVGQVALEPVAIHSSFQDEILDALDESDRVFLATWTRGGISSRQVSYVVIRDPAGVHRFALDQCGYEDVLIEAYGALYDAFMRQLVGETDPQRLEVLLREVPY